MGTVHGFLGLGRTDELAVVGHAGAADGGFDFNVHCVLGPM